MIKFLDTAFVRGVLFTQGMIAEFDDITESDLIRDGDAETYVAQISGTIDHATTADTATNATNATNAINAQFATSAQSAVTASSANTANTATSANTANIATTALSATNATNADHAITADTASTADHATTASSASSATNATAAEGVVSAGTIVKPVLARPVELLKGSALAVSCTSTGRDEVLESFSISAGTVGVNSILQIEPLWAYTNSVDNKILKVKVGGVTVFSGTRTTSTREAPLIVLANRNSLSSQIRPVDGNYYSSATGAPTTYSIDFSVNVTVELIGQRASSGDTLTLEYFRVMHFIGE
jgi:hypothetical protein